MESKENIGDLNAFIARLTEENKRYVIAMANALLFSEGQMEAEKKDRLNGKGCDFYALYGKGSSGEIEDQR